MTKIGAYIRAHMWGKGHGRRLEPCHEMRALIVDDEPDVIKALHRVIHNGLPDLVVDEARNGEEALAFFKKNHHVVIVMDLHMPVMNGYESFDEIRHLCETQRWEMPAVIFVTGYCASSGVKQVVEHDSKHCLLLKPVAPAAIVLAVESRCRTAA